MSKSLFEPHPYREIAKANYGVHDLRQKPLAFRWWQPQCVWPLEDPCTDTRNCYSGCTQEMNAVQFQNNWRQPSDSSGLEKFAFRLHADGSLEFKGHLDTSGGASSGTVAFTLPGAVPGEIDFLLPNSQFFHTTITNDDGLSFTLALVHIDAVTGDVTITWPAT